MQALTRPPRTDLDPAKVAKLIVEPDSLEVRSGLNVLDEFETVIAEDVPMETGSQLTRDLTGDLHLSADFRIAQEFDWQRIRLAPWMELTGMILVDGVYEQMTARFALGVLVPDGPALEVGYAEMLDDGTPGSMVYGVSAYDKLQLLDVPLYDSFVVESDEVDVLTRIGDLLADHGETKIRLNQNAAGLFHRTGQFWSPTDGSTALQVANELLDHVAYRPLASDVDGYLVSGPLERATTRSDDWTYDSGRYSILGLPMAVERLYLSMPNWFVFVNDAAIDEVPVEGAGQVTLVNVDSGPASLQQRGGRRVPVIESLSAADHAQLLTLAYARLDEVGQDSERATLRVGCNPLHWGYPRHGDIVKVTVPEVGYDKKYEVEAWTLPLSGEDMQLEVRVVTDPIQAIPLDEL